MLSFDRNNLYSIWVKRNHTYTFRAPSFDFIGMGGSGRLQILASPGEAAFSRLWYARRVSENYLVIY